MKLQRLQFQIWLVMGLLSIGIAVPMGALVIITSEYLEKELLNQTIHDEMAFMLQQLEKDPDTLLPQTNTLKVWLDIDSQLQAPEPFHSLPVGETHDIEYLDKRWHIFRKQTTAGLVTAAIDITHVESRERLLDYIVTLIVGSVLLLSLLLSVLLAKRLAKPAAQLARILNELDPNDKTPLAEQFSLDEMRQIAIATDGLRARQHQLMERERLFTAAASHELRTPLATINASLELLQLIGITEEQQAAFERTQRASVGLSDLVDSLLFIARDNETQDNTEADIGAIAANCLATQKEQRAVSELDWQIRITQNARVTANPLHVRVVITNLLRNAAQHTDTGLIEVVVEANGFAICDNGEGLPETPWEELLQPYVSGRDRNGQQFGLGLYIVERICSHYGWQITAQPNQDRGTRMQVII